MVGCHFGRQVHAFGVKQVAATPSDANDFVFHFFLRFLQPKHNGERNFMQGLFSGFRRKLQLFVLSNAANFSPCTCPSMGSSGNRSPRGIRI